MLIGISVFELHLPHARSLKEKRKVVKGLIDRIHRRFRVSVAETDFHDLHQRAEMGIAAIVRSDGDGRRLMDAIRELIDCQHEATLSFWEPQFLEEGR
jgi:uncharacterized protein YlxP (DUF503 family)